MAGLTDAELDALEGSKPKKGLSSEELLAMESSTPPAPQAAKPSMLESGLRGAAQGATLGFSDEISGLPLAATAAMSGDPSKILEAYRKSRDQSRGANELARQTNPGSFAAGEVGGGIASAFVPGMNALTGAKALNTFGNAALSGARVGALMGLGTSNADLTKGDVGNAAVDVGVGAGTGAATSLLTKGAIDTVKSLNPTGVATKLSKVFFGTPEEVTEAYIANPEAVKNSPMRYELAQKFEEAVGELKKQVAEGSQTARKALENIKVAGSESAGTLEPITTGLEKRSEGVWDDPARKSAYDYLKSLQGKFNPAESATPPEYSGNRLKDAVQSMQRATQYESAPGQFLPADQGIMKQGAGALNDLLKSKSPEYAQEMQGVAADTGLLGRVADVDKSPAGMANLFRKMQTDKYGAAQIPRQTVEEFDKRMGSDFLGDMKNSYAKEMLDKSVTNGSRNVNLFSKMLEGIPVVGKPLGALAGATVDKFGNQLTQGSVDFAAKLNQVMKEEGPQEFMKQVQPLVDAARKSNPAAILTLQLLTKSNPEALKYLQPQEEK